MKEKPASTKASSSLCDVASSAVQPNTLPPKAMGANSRLDLPSLRFSMLMLLASCSSPAIAGEVARRAGGVMGNGTGVHDPSAPFGGTSPRIAWGGRSSHYSAAFAGAGGGSAGAAAGGGGGAAAGGAM